MTTKLIHVEASFLLIHNFITKSCFSSQVEEVVPKLLQRIVWVNCSFHTFIIHCFSKCLILRRRTCRCPFLCIASSIYYVFVWVAWLIPCLLCRFSTGVIIFNRDIELSWVIHGVSRKLLSILFVTVATEESVLFFQARSTFWKHFVNLTFEFALSLSEDRRACEFPFSGVSRVTGQLKLVNCKKPIERWEKHWRHFFRTAPIKFFG